MKLSSIRIQNFKSFKDTKFKVSDLHLFIGANNSGKSNFFKALTFFSSFFEIGRASQNLDLFNINSFNKLGLNHTNPYGLTLIFRRGNLFYHFKFEMYAPGRGDFAIFCGISSKEELNFELFDLNKIHSVFDQYRLFGSENNYTKRIGNKFNSKMLIEIVTEANKSGYNIDVFVDKKNNNYKPIHHTREVDGFFYEVDRHGDFSAKGDFPGFGKFLRNFTNSIKIYKPDPNSIVEPRPLLGDDFVNEDASNLVSFFDRMKDLHLEVMERINKDLNHCIKDFRDIRLDTIHPTNEIYGTLKNYYKRDTFKKIGISDINKKIFWAEELSEGTLYFIALLAIIHQPNPPSIILLEEPEKGIHPRRIQEVVLYLQELCDEKDIQVFVTTHSPIVVDQFANDTSKIFVFDKVSGETKIQNLKKDIIEPKNKALKIKKMKPINYEESLGEHWLMGLLNGVPND